MKKWITLVASVIMQTCLGGIYAWSTFTPALEREHGYHPGQSGMVFGVCIAIFTISMVFGGIMQMKYGPRRTGLAGGILFLAGYLTGALAHASFPLLLAGFGVIAGAGIGLAYVCPLATGVKWFPHHKGAITGVTVAGFGLGGVFMAKAAQYLLNRGTPVLQSLNYIGVAVGILVILGALLLFTPPVMSTGRTSPMRIKDILTDKQFHLLFGMMFAGTFAGLLVIGNLKPLGMSAGLSPAMATVAVMLFAVGNAAGRIAWGMMHDKLGTRVLPACMVLLTAAAAGIILMPSTAGFLLFTLLIAFAFGGFFVMFAAEVADTFGAERISDVYPLVFLGYGLAGLMGPTIGGLALHLTGSPVAAVVFALLSGLLGIGMACFYRQAFHLDKMVGMESHARS